LYETCMLLAGDGGLCLSGFRNSMYVQGRLNQWAHWARAQGPGFFLFEGPQLAVVK